MARLDIRSLTRQFVETAKELRKTAGNRGLLVSAGDRIRALSQRRGSSVAIRKVEPVVEHHAVQASPLHGNNDVQEHIADIVQKRLHRLTEVRNFESAADPVEALHDLRVASRRLRAFVDVFEPLVDPETGKRAKKHLRHITRAVRLARDWDVQMAMVRHRMAHTESEIEQIALEDLLAMIAKRRQRELKVARRRLRKLDMGDVNLTLCALLGMTMSALPRASDGGSRYLWQLVKPFALPQASSVEKPQSDNPRALHDFRIQMKKLRYALELIEPALGSSFQRLYAPVEDLQDLLGKHQDLVVLEKLVHRRRNKLDKQKRHALAHALWGFGKKIESERQEILAQHRARTFDLEAWRRSLRQQLS